MSRLFDKTAKADSRFLSLFLVSAVFLVAASYANPAHAQETAKKNAPATAGSNVSPAARGQYLVEGVAMCGTCHTPRLSNGQLDKSKWLSGAPVPYQPSQPTANWPTVAPRLAGLPPTSVDGMVTLLTTGIWIDGKQLRDPMPKFHMTKADAEAVVAYLKTLAPQR